MKSLLYILIVSFVSLKLIASINPLYQTKVQNPHIVISKWEHENKLIPVELPNDDQVPFYTISRGYRIFKNSTIAEAREIILSYSQSLLNCINSNEQIRPQLGQYPFTADDLSISIRLIDEDTNTFATLPSLALISLNKGKIIYVGSERKLSPLINLAEESFEEALQLSKDMTQLNEK